MNNAKLLHNIKNFRRVNCKSSPSTNLAFSSTIIRKDKKNIEEANLEANAHLKILHAKSIGYTDNSGMEEVYLGKKVVR